MRENTKAEVFLHRLAFEKYYALRSNDEPEYIGLDEELKQNKRIVFTSDRFFVSKGVQVFSNITRKEPLPKSNDSLLMKHASAVLRHTYQRQPF